MRIVMEYAWQGIAGGSAGSVQKVRKDPEGKGTLLTVKFDYGEVREVPQVATIAETTWKNLKMEPKT
jgi:hypothetical protein